MGIGAAGKRSRRVVDNEGNQCSVGAITETYFPVAPLAAAESQWEGRRRSRMCCRRSQKGGGKSVAGIVLFAPIPTLLVLKLLPPACQLPRPPVELMGLGPCTEGPVLSLYDQPSMWVMGRGECSGDWDEDVGKYVI